MKPLARVAAVLVFGLPALGCAWLALGSLLLGWGEGPPSPLGTAAALLAAAVLAAGGVWLASSAPPGAGGRRRPSGGRRPSEDQGAMGACSGP